jgi:ubiquinol-cytochrome c reductase subunit 6
MGISDFFTDVWETFAHPSPDAEVQGGTSTKTPASGTDEESSEEAEVNKQDAKSGGDSGEQGHKPSSKPSDEDDEPEEEEEDEEEPDPKEKLEKGEFTLDAQFRGVTGSKEVPSFWVESMHWTGL